MQIDPSVEFGAVDTGPNIIISVILSFKCRKFEDNHNVVSFRQVKSGSIAFASPSFSGK